MDREERKFVPSRECKITAKARLNISLNKAKACLAQFEEVELHGVAQASERVTQVAAILAKEKDANITKVQVKEIEIDAGRLAIKMIVTLRRAKK